MHTYNFPIRLLFSKVIVNRFLFGGNMDSIEL